jgi:hypothetical protein
MPTLTELQQRLEQNDVRYNLHFAGLPRITRSLETMDDLIATAQQVLGESRGLKKGPESERLALQQNAERQLELYRGERTAIVQARTEGGTEGLQASTLGTRANFVFHRYARHFAGQSRSSRDLTLMLDMIAELEAIQGAMQDLHTHKPLPVLQADMEVVAGRLQQFHGERKAIGAARSDGTPADQAGVLANAANTVFAQYRVYFAGQPRVTRRPELLVRLLGALEELRDRMAALQTQGLFDENNDNNLGIVTSRIQAWQQELAAVRAERQKATIQAMVADLGTAANAELESYGQHFAGKSRKTRDAKRLSDLLDRLDEVERQMTRVDQFQQNVDNTRNLSVVRDALALYENEFDEIRKVQEG